MATSYSYSKGYYDIRDNTSGFFIVPLGYRVAPTCDRIHMSASL